MTISRAVNKAWCGIASNNRACEPPADELAQSKAADPQQTGRLRH